MQLYQTVLFYFNTASSMTKPSCHFSLSSHPRSSSSLRWTVKGSNAKITTYLQLSSSKCFFVEGHQSFFSPVHISQETLLMLRRSIFYQGYERSSCLTIHLRSNLSQLVQHKCIPKNLAFVLMIMPALLTWPHTLDIVYTLIEHDTKLSWYIKHFGLIQS